MNTRPATSRLPRLGNLNRSLTGSIIPRSRSVQRMSKRWTERRPRLTPPRQPEPLRWEEGKLRQQAMAEVRQGR